MQSKSRPLDDISNFLTNAAGALKGVGDEVKAMSRSQAEKFIADMDLVSRDEHEVLKARLDKALAEIEALKKAKSPKPAAKKSASTKKPASTKKTVSAAKEGSAKKSATARAGAKKPASTKSNKSS
ncbi:accessory factor UbiK family protein [Litorimonas haliclonae]|uniref:accessory factor UbiK family protein n=1 Tax=Litorimonas haliclonae TaxID=2081977 RepID=UPI0039EEEA77